MSTTTTFDLAHLGEETAKLLRGDWTTRTNIWGTEPTLHTARTKTYVSMYADDNHLFFSYHSLGEGDLPAWPELPEGAEWDSDNIYLVNAHPEHGVAALAARCAAVIRAALGTFA